MMDKWYLMTVYADQQLEFERREAAIDAAYEEMEWASSLREADEAAGPYDPDRGGGFI